jgi:serine/threonine protein kinase
MHSLVDARIETRPILPRSFGRYVLFDFIGKGGMAEIYLARQKTDLGAARLCVVKQILPELANDDRFSEMLVHEAKLAAQLSHANVVQVFDLGREEGRLYIAMEYVEGFDLNDLLRRCSRQRVPMPFELGVHVVRAALTGLDYAHRRKGEDGKPLGIVHRDVSPSNLLVSFEGEVKVCDFGIARALASEGESADAARGLGEESLAGKAGYMSPEQARGESVDARADVFAAGIVLWELSAGRRLYRGGEGRPSLIEQARAAQIPELPDRGMPEAEELGRIVGKALTVDREARYASAGAMLRDLDAYAARARLVTSTIALGEWLAKSFGADIVTQRRSRERAVAALERGAPAVVEVIAPPSSPIAFGGVDLGPPSSAMGGLTDTATRGRPRAWRVAVAIVVVAVVVAAAVIVAMRP